jgi:hypothetical protein
MAHDLGPLQINTWWVARIATLIGRPEAHVRHWLRFDPCFNAEAARWVFLTALRSSGDYWKAVGAYHSQPHGDNETTSGRWPAI